MATSKVCKRKAVDIFYKMHVMEYVQSLRPLNSPQYCCFIYYTDYEKKRLRVRWLRRNK